MVMIAAELPPEAWVAVGGVIVAMIGGPVMFVLNMLSQRRIESTLGQIPEDEDTSLTQMMGQLLDGQTGQDVRIAVHDTKLADHGAQLVDHRDQLVNHEEQIRAQGEMLDRHEAWLIAIRGQGEV